MIVRSLIQNRNFLNEYIFRYRNLGFIEMEIINDYPRNNIPKAYDLEMRENLKLLPL